MLGFCSGSEDASDHVCTCAVLCSVLHEEVKDISALCSIS
jgi:hypothetical protein